jgi:hypothetical protein
MVAERCAAILRWRLDPNANGWVRIRCSDAGDVVIGVSKHALEWSNLLTALRNTCEYRGILELRILAERDLSDPTTLISSNRQYNGPVHGYLDQLAKNGPDVRGDGHYRWFKISDTQSERWPEDRYVIGQYAGTRCVLAHAEPDMGLLDDEPPSWSVMSA